MSIEEAIRSRAKSTTLSHPHKNTNTNTNTHSHSKHEVSKITDHDIVMNESDGEDGGVRRNVDAIGKNEINKSKLGRNKNHLEEILDLQDSTIVRMEVTYKSSMTSELDITCNDDAHSISTYTPELNSSINSNEKFRIHHRRTVGEVFNHRYKNKKENSKDSKINSSDDSYYGPSATYTCYWSGTS